MILFIFIFPNLSTPFSLERSRDNLDFYLFGLPQEYLGRLETRGVRYDEWVYDAVVKMSVASEAAVDAGFSLPDGALSLPGHLVVCLDLRLLRRRAVSQPQQLHPLHLLPQLLPLEDFNRLRQGRTLPRLARLLGLPVTPLLVQLTTHQLEDAGSLE